MTDFKLRECPFCGGDAEYIERGNEHIGLKETVVRCKSCNCKQEHKWFLQRLQISLLGARTVSREERSLLQAPAHERR